VNGVWKNYKTSFITCTLRQIQNDQIDEDKIGRARNASGEKKYGYTLLVGKPERKEQLKRTA
jgi:hypothetical protein